MSKRANDGENSESSKQQKLNAGDSNIDRYQELQPAIFKLNAICCEDLFEWLSLCDLHSLGQTCRRMERLTGRYFQENFKEPARFRNKNFYYGNLRIGGFYRYIQNIQLDIPFNRKSSKRDYLFIAANCESLRQITFYNMTMTEDIIKCFKERLEKIEEISLKYHKKGSSVNLYEHLFQFCPNLKTLHLKYFDPSDYEWMCHKYPKLEHLIINKNPDETMSEHIYFFLNEYDHLQSFETDYDFLFKNIDIIIDLTVKIDLLKIYYSRNYSGDVCTLANVLYDIGFYKRLEISFANGIITQDRINQIGTLRGLEKLVGNIELGIMLPKIVSLKKWQFCGGSRCMGEEKIKSVAIAFPNVCQVHVCCISIAGLLEFVRYLPKLQQISISTLPLSDSTKFPDSFYKLENEREKLPGACKINIYVQESIYLKTKIAAKNLYGNYNLIEIKRFESGKITSKCVVHQIPVVFD